MQLSIQPNSTVSIILDTTLNADNTGPFREYVREALGRSPREIIIDCGKLTYIDSTGLGLLTLARTEGSRIGCKIRLANILNPHVREVMDLMQFPQLFEMTSVPKAPLPPTHTSKNTSAPTDTKGAKPAGTRVIR